MKTSLCLLSAVFLFALSSCSKDDKKPDPVKPVAGFSSDVKKIVPGGKVNFKDTSTNSPTSWTWIFEGGTPGISSAQNPDNIVYAAAGTYEVSLIVANAAGISELVEVQNYITVKPNAVKPVAGFSSDVTVIIPEGKVNFKDTSTNSPTSWTWTFEGGTPGSSSAQNPVDIVYETAGTYKVSLVATNSAGSDTMEKYIIVTPGPNSILPKTVKYTRYRGSSDNYTATFDYEGNKIKEIRRGRNNDNSSFSFIYNTGNKIIKVERSKNYDYNGNGSTDYTYENNNLKSYQTWKWDGINYRSSLNDIIKYTYNSDGIIVAFENDRYNKNSSVFTLDIIGNIIEVAYSNGEVLTIEYDTRNNPYKNILGYSSLLLTKYDISEIGYDGFSRDVPHSIDAFDQDAYSINNITKEEKKDKNGKIISTTTFENTHNANNFLTKTVVKSNPAKDSDGTYEYAYLGLKN